LPGRWIIRTLFTSKFLPSVPLMLPLAIAAFFQGLYQPLTLFLAAHKKGKELRFTAFVQAGFNVVGNLVLIYLWGPLGAGIASAIAKAIELTLNVHFYRKTQASLPAEPDHEPTTAIDGVRSAKDR